MSDEQNTISKARVREIVRKEIERFARAAGLPYDPPELFDGFDPGALGWSPVNALCLARASVLAYQPKAAVEAALRASGINRFERRWLEDERTDTEGFACEIPAGPDSAEEPAGLLVAFRGTESKLDVKIDVKKKLVPLRVDGTEHGRVHEGFLEALDSVWPKVADFLEKKEAGPGRRVWFTGHSLGGALATLACARLALGSGEPVVGGLYTFGQPRVGDATFRDATVARVGRDRIFRVYRCADPVPMLPKAGYKHVSGERCYISRSGAFELGGSGSTKVVERLSTWVLLALKVATSGGQVRELRGLVSDHFSEGYLTSIRNVRRLAITEPAGEEPAGGDSRA